MSPNQQLSALFDGDSVFEYHQDYIEERSWSHLTSPNFILPLSIFIVAASYHLFYSLDYNLLSLPELLWNCLVYLTPSGLLDAIESYTNPLRITNPDLKHIPRTHAAKSEAMRRILGLDTAGGLMSSVAQAGKRRMSSLPGASSFSQGDDRKPPGLGNWDNSCYQNSVLQGLASLDPLEDYLRKPEMEEEIADMTSKPDMKMVEALRGLISTLNDPENNGRRIWTPATLKSMSSWQQQDAQEYFSKVLDAIDKEFLTLAKFKRSSLGLDMDESTSSTAKIAESLPMSAFRSPLEGTLAQRVGCTRCGFSEGLSMIPFNCLTVPLGKDSEYDVRECLDEYTKLEPIDGVECGKCTLLKMSSLLSTIKERVKENPDSPVYKNTVQRLEAVTEALEEDDYEEKTLLQKCGIPCKNRVSTTKSRQAVISRAPRSLVIHFNRSMFDELTGDMTKNPARVQFPKKLDLGPWTLGSTGISQDPTAEEWCLSPDQPMIASSARPSRVKGPFYELRAVVKHYGRHENGHYVCYKKHRVPPAQDDDFKNKEQWWRLSDDDVMKVSELDVLSQGDVFMLFYDCVQPASYLSSRSPAPEVTTHIIPGLSELETAVAIALPDLDDSDLVAANDDATIDSAKDESVAASTSEYEEEENDEQETEEYKPTQPIIFTHYIPKAGLHKEQESTARKRIVSAGNLVMV